MVQFGIGPWLYGNAFMAGIYSNDKCNDFFDLAFNRKKLSMRMGGNVSVVLNRKINLRLIANPVFQSNAIQGVYDIKNMFTLNASLRWSPINGAWSIIASGENITKRRFDTTSTLGNQYFKMKVCQDWPTFAFSVIYKFGNHKEKQHKDIDVSRLRQ